jgi:hypothetical protein
MQYMTKNDSSTQEEFRPSHTVITLLEFRGARSVFDVGELRAVTWKGRKRKRKGIY